MEIKQIIPICLWRRGKARAGRCFKKNENGRTEVNAIVSVNNQYNNRNQ